MPPGVLKKPRSRRAYPGPACPRCQVRAAGALESGEVTCRRCRLRYRASVFVAPEDPAPPVIAIDSSSSRTPCARHARNSAETACSRCGAFMCQLCRIDSDGMTLCPPCFDRLAGEGALPSARRTYRDHSRIALTLAVGGFLLMFGGLGVLMGPPAIWSGVRGLRQRSQDGIAVSKVRCVIAIVIGAIVSLFGVFIVIGLVAAAQGHR